MFQNMTIGLKWIGPTLFSSIRNRLQTGVWLCVFKMKIHCSRSIYTTEIKFRSCVNDGNKMFRENYKNIWNVRKFVIFRSDSFFVSIFTKTSGPVKIFMDVQYVENCIVSWNSWFINRAKQGLSFRASVPNALTYCNSFFFSWMLLIPKSSEVCIQFVQFVIFNRLKIKMAAVPFFSV